MDEIWKPVVGYEGLYEVSNLGRVKSLPKRGYKSGGILKQRCKDDYMDVRVSKNNKKHTLSVHRAVAEAFIPNPDNKLVVNHIDGNKSNNCVNNLEWNTYSENSKHAICTGLVDKEFLVNHMNEIRMKSIAKTSKKIKRDDGKTYNSIADAARDVGVNPSVISRVLSGCRGKKTAAGHTWEYV